MELNDLIPVFMILQTIILAKVNQSRLERVEKSADQAHTRIDNLMEKRHA